MMLASLFKKKEKKAKGLIAIDIAPTQIAFAQVLDVNTTNPKGIKCGAQNCTDFKDLLHCVNDIVNKNGFQNFDCNIVLHPDYYQLLLIDKPKVQESEYKLAIRWQIKEMVNIPPEDMAIEFFKPSPNIPDHSKKLYVIVSKISLLKTITDALQNASLNPVSIDIHAFAIRNLLSLVVKSNSSTAFLHLLENKSIFYIFENNDLNLARHLVYGITRFMVEEISYDIIMELKHTLDYYQHQLNKPLPDKILIPSISNYCPAIAGKLSTMLEIKSDCFNINELGLFPQPLSEKLQRDCYIALGGALRKEELT